MAFDRCKFGMGNSYFIVKDFNGTTRTIGRMPELCEPALGPIVLNHGDQKYWDVSGLRMKVSDVKFSWNGNPLIGPKSGFADPGKYYETIIVTAVLEGSGLTFWVGHVSGNQTPYP